MFYNEDIKNINVKLKDTLLFELFNVYIYTGLRMQELWQSTIKTEIDTNIIYFDVAGTKTKESNRKVPMHSELIKLRITQDWLLTLKSSYKNNKSTSRKINTIIKDVVNDKKKTLYSARHFFTTELLKADVGKSKIDKLVGHSDKKDLTTNTYGRSAFTLEILKIEIEKINLN